MMISRASQLDTVRNRYEQSGAMVDEATVSKPFTAARKGFSINAAVGFEARERGKLERVCRYMAGPPISERRLSVDGDGLVVYELKHPFSERERNGWKVRGKSRLSAAGSWANAPPR